MAEVICQNLQLVSIELAVIPRYLAVARSASTLDTFVTQECVPLLHHQVVSDQGFIPFLPELSGSSDSFQLPSHDNGKMAITHTVSEHDNGLWLVLGHIQELLYQFLDSILHVLDYLLVLAKVLHSYPHFIL